MGFRCFKRQSIICYRKQFNKRAFDTWYSFSSYRKNVICWFIQYLSWCVHMCLLRNFKPYKNNESFFTAYIDMTHYHKEKHKFRNKHYCDNYHDGIVYHKDYLYYTVRICVQIESNLFSTKQQTVSNRRKCNWYWGIQDFYLERSALIKHWYPPPYAKAFCLMRLSIKRYCIDHICPNKYAHGFVSLTDGYIFYLLLCIHVIYFLIFLRVAYWNNTRYSRYCPSACEVTMNYIDLCHLMINQNKCEPCTSCTRFTFVLFYCILYLDNKIWLKHWRKDINCACF